MIDDWFPYWYIDIPLLISHSNPSSPRHPHGASSDADPPPPARRAARGTRRQDVGRRRGRSKRAAASDGRDVKEWMMDFCPSFMGFLSNFHGHEIKKHKKTCVYIERRKFLKKWWYLYEEFTIS